MSAELFVPPPLLAGLQLAPAAFSVPTGTVKTVGDRETTVRYSASQPAPVVFTIDRITGRRGGIFCRKHPHFLRCLRRQRIRGSLSRHAHKGANRLGFTGRMHGHALSSGRYQLNATPRDRYGHLAITMHAAFRIVR
jgi:hypothetical protein